MCPHLEYDMPACSPNLVTDINHLELIQRIATRLVTGMRHLPYEERLQRLGLRALQRRRLRADLITAVVTAPSVNVFKKRLEKVWTEIFPHLPIARNLISPIPLHPHLYT